MKSILITGAYGLVGSASYGLFKEKGWDVVGIDNNGRSDFFGVARTYAEHDQRNIAEIDIRDEQAINKLFSERKFDAIIHAAGQPSHDYATYHVLEDFDVNARGTVILLEATRKYCPDATFVFVSTDKVYGENMDGPLKETETRYELNGKKGNLSTGIWSLTEKGFNESLVLDFAGDRSFFGCSKAAADMYAQQYAVRGMKVGIFRPGCITGKNHKGAEKHGFLAYLAQCIKHGKIYRIFGNGKNVRDQIHANDLANAFAAFIANPVNGGVYNMGGGPDRSVSIIEAGELFSRAIGRPFLHEFAEARLGDRLWDIHDVSKFRKDYPDWDYRYSLQNIIDDLV